jgi:hypothetical protein
MRSKLMFHGVYDPVNVFSTGTGCGVSFLLPPVPLGGTDFLNFNTKVNGFGGGWSFKVAANSLANNSLVITADDVCCSGLNPSFVGIEGVRGSTDGFAVQLSNLPAGMSTHWVQVIADNSNIMNNPGYGNLENVVATRAGVPLLRRRSGSRRD